MGNGGVVMRIVNSVPPMFDKILRVFPNAKRPGVVFCWGDVIYNPAGVYLSPEIIEHEQVHSQQQKNEPLFWWERYLYNKQFRLDQEIPAHRAEYWAYKEYFNNRALRRAALHRIAERLAGPLYGGLISVADAKRLLKQDYEVSNEPAFRTAIRENS